MACSKRPASALLLAAQLCAMGAELPSPAAGQHMAALCSDRDGHRKAHGGKQNRDDRERS